MARALWLITPYISLLGVLRCRTLNRLVVEHTVLTLIVGWFALAVVFAAVAGLITVPVAALVVCAALSGMAMLTSRRDEDDDGDDGPDDDPPEPPPPGLDWAEFDRLRRVWERDPVAR